MSALGQVRWARRAMLVTATARAALAAFAAASGVIVLGMLPALAGRPLPVDDLLAPAASGCAIVAAAVLLWRARAVVHTHRVALWIEEQSPALDYALVTAIDASTPAPAAAHLERTVAGYALRPIVRRRLGRSLRTPFAAAAIAGLALLALSVTGAAAGPLARLRGVERPPPLVPDAPSRLARVRAIVTPPAYARQRVIEVGDASSVTALVGSAVELRGPGPAAGVSATIGADTIAVSDSRGDWRLGFAMPRRPAALQLRDRAHRRVLVIAPVIDAPPTARLLAPVRDSVLRAVPRGALQLSAEAADDVGLAEGWFEIIVSSGAGEEFTAKTTTTRPTALAAVREGGMRASITAASLQLGPGDVISMRAIVRDANDVTGPGIAVSETRTWRIVGEHENDSVSINAAPATVADSNMFTQRMLIRKTEALQAARPEIERPSFERQSQALGADQAKLRQTVGAIVSRERNVAGGGTEVMSTVTRQLQLAWDAMQQAEVELLIAETETALPHMRRALVYLDSVRKAERLYLRSRPPRIVVDVARVRLTGEEKGTSSVRAPGVPADTLRDRLREGLLGALDLIERDAEQAMNALGLLRVRALAGHPEVAAALGEAVDAMRSGRDATASLVRARRALDGGAVAVPSSKWGVAW